jgi:[ribosomal protein S18]-alanine N-acetyltransferase
MLYRLFQPGDFAQLYAVEEVCFQPPFRFSRALMRKLTEGQRFVTWIAEESGQLAGFAIVDLQAASSSAYIQTIEVAPESRGQGIGSELLRRVECSAYESDAHSLWLHVDTENKAAIRLYEAHGYMREGREEHYYARHRAAFVYRKALMRLENMQGEFI